MTFRERRTQEVQRQKRRNKKDLLMIAGQVICLICWALCVAGLLTEVLDEQTTIFYPVRMGDDISLRRMCRHYHSHRNADVAWIVIEKAARQAAFSVSCKVV
jgi:hypothetical protein